MPNSVYEACKPYVGLFEKHAAANGMPPILLAAIAMQESESTRRALTWPKVLEAVRRVTSSFRRLL